VADSGATIPASNIAYASGDAAPDSTALALVPGQPAGTPAVPLTAAVTAFTGSGSTTDTAASWNPTIVITVPAGVGVGDYHGTITHSAY
jgi:hypothetical protein